MDPSSPNDSLLCPLLSIVSSSDVFDHWPWCFHGLVFARWSIKLLAWSLCPWSSQYSTMLAFLFDVRLTRLHHMMCRANIDLASDQSWKFHMILAIIFEILYLLACIMFITSTNWWMIASFVGHLITRKWVMLAHTQSLGVYAKRSVIVSVT